MTELDAGRLLAVIILVDPRFPAPDDRGVLRALWAKWLADVPYDAALKATQAYYRSEAYAQNREPIAPANIALWWQARRRPTDAERIGTTDPERRALPAPPVDPDRIRAGVDAVRAALRTGTAPRADAPTPADAADAVAQQRAHRARPCRHCGADAGRPCVDVRGNPLTRTDAHPSRTAPDAATPRGSADTARRELTSGGTT